MRRILSLSSLLYLLVILCIGSGVSAETVIWVGDVGTVLRIVTGEDISSSTAKNILLGKPDGSVLNKTASYFSDGTDGVIQYTTVADDVDAAGTWTIQAKLTFGTDIFYTTQGTFTVSAPLTP